MVETRGFLLQRLRLLSHRDSRQGGSCVKADLRGENESLGGIAAPHGIEHTARSREQKRTASRARKEQIPHDVPAEQQHDPPVTRSSIIFVPAGVSHNPMRILKADRPIFHFSVVTKTAYDGEATYR